MSIANAKYVDLVSVKNVSKLGRSGSASVSTSADSPIGLCALADESVWVAYRSGTLTRSLAGSRVSSSCRTFTSSAFFVASTGPYVVLLGRDGNEGVRGTATSSSANTSSSTATSGLAATAGSGSLSSKCIVVHGYRTRTTDKLELSVAFTEQVPLSPSGLEPAMCTVSGDLEALVYGFADGSIATRTLVGRDNKKHRWASVFGKNMSVGYLEALPCIGQSSRLVFAAHISMGNSSVGGLEIGVGSGNGERKTLMSLRLRSSGELEEVARESVQVSAVSLLASQQTLLVLSNQSQAIYFFHAQSGNTRAIPLEWPGSRIFGFGKYILLESVTGGNRKLRAYLLMGKSIVETYRDTLSETSPESILVAGCSEHFLSYPSDARLGSRDAGIGDKSGISNPGASQSSQPGQSSGQCASAAVLYFLRADGSLCCFEPKTGLLAHLVSANAYLEALDVCASAGNEKAEAATVVRYAEWILKKDGRVETETRVNESASKTPSPSSTLPASRKAFDLLIEYASNPCLLSSTAIHLLLARAGAGAGAGGGSGLLEFSVSADAFAYVVSFLCSRWDLLDAPSQAVAISCALALKKLTAGSTLWFSSNPGGHAIQYIDPLAILQCVSDSSIADVISSLATDVLQQLSDDDRGSLDDSSTLSPNCVEAPSNGLNPKSLGPLQLFLAYPDGTNPRDVSDGTKPPVSSVTSAPIQRPAEVACAILTRLVEKGAVALYKQVVKLPEFQPLLSKLRNSPRTRLAFLLHGTRDMRAQLGKGEVRSTTAAAAPQIDSALLQAVRKMELLSGSKVSAAFLKAIGQSDGHFGDVRLELSSLLQKSSEALDSVNANLTKRTQDTHQLSVLRSLSSNAHIVFKGFEECGGCKSSAKSPFYAFSCGHVYHINCCQLVKETSVPTCQLCRDQLAFTRKAIDSEITTSYDGMTRSVVAATMQDAIGRTVYPS